MQTGAKIIIRGKGSVKEGKIGRKDGQPLPGEDEPLHAYVTANNPENVKKAVEKVHAVNSHLTLRHSLVFGYLRGGGEIVEGTAVCLPCSVFSFHPVLPIHVNLECDTPVTLVINRHDVFVSRTLW